MPSSTPCAIPRERSSGVDGTFQVSILPACSSNRQMSVNVPSESTPTLHRDMPLALFQVAPAGMIVGLLFLASTLHTHCSSNCTHPSTLPPSIILSSYCRP